MLHDIAPHVLSNAYSPRAPQGEDPALCFDPEGVYLKGGGFPTCADYPAALCFWPIASPWPRSVSPTALCAA